VTTADVYRALWRHKAFIVLMTAGVVAAAWFLTTRQTPVYEGSTKVHIFPPLAEGSNPQDAADVGERLAQTYAEAAGTVAIARKVHEQLNGEIPFDEIHGKISGEASRGLEFLTISARNESAERAQLIANAVPEALKSYIGDFESLSGLEVSVVDPAVAPSEPASPNLELNLALALLVGLIFNAGLALLIEALGDRIHDPEELEQLTGQPVLATIPPLKFTNPRGIAKADAARRRESAGRSKYGAEMLTKDRSEAKSGVAGSS
jgi:polysaccharide biosynthesis transport protein